MIPSELIWINRLSPVTTRMGMPGKAWRREEMKRLAPVARRGAHHDFNNRVTVDVHLGGVHGVVAVIHGHLRPHVGGNAEEMLQSVGVAVGLAAGLDAEHPQLLGILQQLAARAGSDAHRRSGLVTHTSMDGISFGAIFSPRI